MPKLEHIFVVLVGVLIYQFYVSDTSISLSFFDSPIAVKTVSEGAVNPNEIVPIAKSPGEAPQTSIYLPPVQSSTRRFTLAKLGDFSIDSLATFALDARVLSAKRYNDGTNAKFAPVDLALGWQKMARKDVINRLTITQSNRWYHYRYPANPPIKPGEIAKQSANMHMIPSSKEVRDTLLKVRGGDVIRLRGNLVHITSPSGWRWKSSTTRNDTGDGACEVVWVEEIEIL